MERSIRFGTDGWRAPAEEMTDDRVRAVGRAIAGHLAERGLAGATVAIGHDARATSPHIAAVLRRTFANAGHDVLVAERDWPTPVFAFTVVDRDLAGAAMVTASHNPPTFNGIKFIPSDGAPALPEVTDAIEEHLEEPGLSGDEVAEGDVQTIEPVEPYVEHLLETVELPRGEMAGISVAYDAIHGSGRGLTDRLLTEAGAIVTRRRCDRDPTFGGVNPEPTSATLGDLVKFVRSGEGVRQGGGEIDLGIANDGDADRVAVVTPARGLLDGDLLYAALYDYLLEAGHAGAAVRSVSTSGIIDRIAEAHGERAIETPVGFKWVAAAMAEHDALIGGEESGGFTIRGHVREKDGVLSALLALAAHAREPLDRRLDRILAAHGPIHRNKRSVECPDEEKPAALAALAGSLPKRIDDAPVERVNDADGFKLVLEDGSWVLIRPSGTEPAIRIYAESDRPERLEALLETGTRLVHDAVASAG